MRLLKASMGQWARRGEMQTLQALLRNHAEAQAEAEARGATGGMAARALSQLLARFVRDQAWGCVRYGYGRWRSFLSAVHHNTALDVTHHNAVQRQELERLKQEAAAQQKEYEKVPCWPLLAQRGHPRHCHPPPLTLTLLC